MRKLLSVSFCLSLVCILSASLVGCGDKKDKKTTTTPAKTSPVEPAKKTNVTVAASPDKWDAQPGETKNVTLKLTREADAKNEVTFEAKSDKEGVTAKADAVKGDKSEGELAISVANDAKDDTYKITVTAKSEKSDASSTSVTVTVKKKVVKVDPTPDKKEISITPAKASLKVKQGDKGESSFKVEFKVVKDAKVAQKGEVKGLKVTIDPDKIAKSGDSAKVTVAADADAKEGDHTVTIEASADGVASSATLTVTVEKKK